jgi:hypothetical protein
MDSSANKAKNMFLEKTVLMKAVYVHKSVYLVIIYIVLLSVTLEDGRLLITTYSPDLGLPNTDYILFVEAIKIKCIFRRKAINSDCTVLNCFKL